MLPAAAISAALCVAPEASADEGFALGRFDPTFAGDRFFGVPSPGAVGPSTLHAMFLLDYAHDPLVLRGVDSGRKYGSIVGDQVALHLNATYALFRRVAFNIDLPVSFQRGDAPQAGGITYSSPSAAGLGDLRLGARAAIWGENTDPFQIALGALLYLPTGTRSAFGGDGAVRSQPQVIVGGLTRWFAWSASMGPELRATRVFSGATSGAALHYGAAIGFLPGDGSFQVGPEVRGTVSFADPQKRTTDAEVMGAARYRFKRDFVVGFGAAVGLAPGAGTPDFRAVASFSYTPDIGPEAGPVVDRDHDGILDTVDACPDEPGVASPDPQKNGCPVISDRDGDGIADAEDACPDAAGVRDVVPKINGCPPDRDNDEIPDAVDACPDQLGVPDADPKKNGCPAPADRDHDGIPDELDACPDVAGVASPDPKKNGCPGDRDGDGINDDKDACPDEKGAPDPDPAKNGCPRDVRVTEGQIVILQQVEFDTDKATIRKVSNPLLDTVANVMREHPEILKIEVGGHTDNRGAAERNMTLSQQRAESVVAALVKRGIDKGRLTANGYGPTRPIMANLTTMGRQKNRRVEFRILERRMKDGSIRSQDAKPEGAAKPEGNKPEGSK
ncbi:outer membrane protein OmpA [Minicystis rosea]|nr:outer membrane protein OmpA [Minicystis rosea]